MTATELRTGVEWNSLLDTGIVDPDGWDRGPEGGVRYATTPITLEDFQRRLTRSSRLHKNVPSLNNAHADIGPINDPRVNKTSVVELLTDFLLNEVPQADDVSIALVHRFAAQIVDNAIVFAKKQHDYGPGNISSFGEVGVLVRVSDKVARLRNLQGRVAKNEAIGDSWLDIANYGAIAQIVREGKWPGCEMRHLLSGEAQDEAACGKDNTTREE